MVWNRVYEPAQVARDTEVKAAQVAGFSYSPALRAANLKASAYFLDAVIAGCADLILGECSAGTEPLFERDAQRL